MKNKNWLVLILIVVIVLSACGRGNSSGSPADTTAVANDNITLDFWYALSGTSGNAVEELVKRFNASQTGITAVAVYQGSYAEAMAKIDAAIAGDTVPNGACTKCGCASFEICYSQAAHMSGLVKPKRVRRVGLK